MREVDVQAMFIDRRPGGRLNNTSSPGLYACGLLRGAGAPVVQTSNVLGYRGDFGILQAARKGWHVVGQTVAYRRSDVRLLHSNPEEIRSPDRGNSLSIVPVA